MAACRTDVSVWAPWKVWIWECDSEENIPESDKLIEEAEKWRGGCAEAWESDSLMKFVDC